MNSLFRNATVYSLRQAAIFVLFPVYLATAADPTSPVTDGFSSSHVVWGSTASQADSLLASTLLGGSRLEEVTDMAIGTDGSVYVVGWTESSDFPTTTGAFDRSLGGERDAFVARLSADLSTLLAATYLGGSEGASQNGIQSWDAANAIKVAPDGVYVVGYTYTHDFPVTVGAFDTDNAGDNVSVFIAKLNLTLDTVVSATFLGGVDGDFGNDIALDGVGYVYVTGFTGGTDFPTTPGAYDSVGGPGNDVFVSRLDGNLTSLIASTLVRDGYGTSLDIDGNGDVFVAGATMSNNFPATPGAYDETCGVDGFCDPDGFGFKHDDVIVARLDGDLTTLKAATYMGFALDDTANSVVLDGNSGVYVSGTSPSFPTTPGAFQTSTNGFNAIFVSRLSTDLASVQVSTVLGGTTPFSPSEGFDMQLVNGQVYVTGETFADDFPTTPDAVDRVHQGANDIVISTFDTELTTLNYSTLLGGLAGPKVEEDQGRAVAVAEDGSIYASGQTISPTFPTTPGAFQETGVGDFDGFVSTVKPGSQSTLSVLLTPLNPPIEIPPPGGSFQYTLTLTNSGTVAQTIDVWIVLSGNGVTRTMGPVSLTLASGAVFSRILTQNVPGGAPPGSYTQTANVGVFPIPDISASFSWEKLTAKEGRPPVVMAWDSNFMAAMSRKEDVTVQNHFDLLQNYPNPFGPATTVTYTLTSPRLVRLAVYDLLGRYVATLVDSRQPAGVHEVVFDAGRLPSGLYFYVMRAGDLVQTRRMVLVK